MRAPISLMLRNGLHAVTQKLVAEVLISSLSTLLVMMLVSHLTRPTPALARSNRTSPPPRARAPRPAEWMMRPPISLSASRSPMSPRRGTSRPPTRGDEWRVKRALLPAPRSASAAPSRRSKDRVAVAGAQKVPSTPAEPQPASTPAPAAADWMNPLQYGSRLFTNVGDFVSASDKRVVEGVAIRRQRGDLLGQEAEVVKVTDLTRQALLDSADRRLCRKWLRSRLGARYHEPRGGQSGRDQLSFRRQGCSLPRSAPSRLCRRSATPRCSTRTPSTA